MAKSNIRVCKFSYCPYDGKKIDISKDDYELVGKSAYYHSLCYEKEKKKKADFELIKNIWRQKINNLVPYSQLNKALNELVERGASTDYLIFVLQYCIDNKLNLNYPAGLIYYASKNDIRDIYKKKQYKKLIHNQKFTAHNIEDNSPKFNIKQKKKGFQDIFN